MTEGDDCGCEASPEADVLAEEITAGEADVPTPGLVN